MEQSSPQSRLIIAESVLADYCVWQSINHGLEIGGYGHVVRRGPDFYCDKIWMLTTTHGSAHMFISGEAAADFIFSRLSEGVDVANLYLHWHSHPLPMSPFFSGTDLNDIREHLEISDHILPVVFSGPTKILAKYVTRTEEKSLRVALELNRYHNEYTRRPVTTWRNQQVFETAKHLPGGKSKKRDDHRNGPYWKLDDPSMQPDGYWIRGNLY